MVLLISYVLWYRSAFLLCHLPTNTGTTDADDPWRTLAKVHSTGIIHARQKERDFWRGRTGTVAMD